MVDIDQEPSNSGIEAEVEAGVNVRNQLTIWDTLIEWRIALQKMLLASNQLPQPLDGESVFKGKSNATSLTQSKLNSLLNAFLDLQDAMVENNSKLYDPQDTDEEEVDDEEIPSDLDDGVDEDVDVDQDSHDPVESGGGSGVDESEDDIDEGKSRSGIKRKMSRVEIEDALRERSEYLKETRNKVLDEWYKKTRFSLASSIKQSKSMESFEQPPTLQIEHILSNQKRLIKRTQLKRSNYSILGKEGNDQEEYDTEIFDDDDFYHQLLRELIDSKTSNDSDSLSVSRKWLEIQKMRSKMKKKVDTRASKGRKIRFDVHKELVNFMAPIVNHNFNEEAKDELFDSLFQTS